MIVTEPACTFGVDFAAGEKPQGEVTAVSARA
jgi:hypothetical protein